MLNNRSNSFLRKLKIVSYLRYIIRIISLYSIGMKKYIEDNEIQLNRIDIIINSIITVIEETIEFIKELVYFRFIGAVKELFDVWHSMVISFMMIFTPRSWWLTSIFWYTVFIMSLCYTPYKHSLRYIDHNCIRNKRHCLSSDHSCTINKFNRV